MQIYKVALLAVVIIFEAAGYALKTHEGVRLTQSQELSDSVLCEGTQLVNRAIISAFKFNSAVNGSGFCFWTICPEENHVLYKLIFKYIDIKESVGRTEDYLLIIYGTHGLPRWQKICDKQTPYSILLHTKGNDCVSLEFHVKSNYRSSFSAIIKSTILSRKRFVVKDDS